MRTAATLDPAVWTVDEELVDLHHLQRHTIRAADFRRILGTVLEHIGSATPPVLVRGLQTGRAITITELADALRTVGGTPPEGL